MPRVGRVDGTADGKPGPRPVGPNPAQPGCQINPKLIQAVPTCESGPDLYGQAPRFVPRNGFLMFLRATLRWNVSLARRLGLRKKKNQRYLLAIQFCLQKVRFINSDRQLLPAGCFSLKYRHASIDMCVAGVCRHRQQAVGKRTLFKKKICAFPTAA